MEIIIPNEKELKQKLESFNKNNFHIVSYFDRTLTKAFINGEAKMSTFAIIREGKYLTPDFTEKDHFLFDKYYPYEFSTELSQEEKHIKMDEWWKKHFELTVKCGITKNVIVDVARNKMLKLREGAFDFFNILNKNKIPLLIFSAGIGNVIKEFLNYKNKLTPNIHIISNFYNFDKEGKVTGVKENFIHVFNKHEYEIKETPYYKEILERKNVILLGDSLGDLGMTEGMEHDTIIRIGFLNDNKDIFLEKYKEAFDIVILDDGDMDYVNELLGKII